MFLPPEAKNILQILYAVYFLLYLNCQLKQLALHVMSHTELLDTFEVNGFTAKVYPSYCSLHPRKDYDNLGTLCLQQDRRHNLPYEADYPTGNPLELLGLLLYGADYEDPLYRYLDRKGLDPEADFSEAVKCLMRRVQKTKVLVPVFMYEHSGIALQAAVNTTPAGCLQGFIYADKALIQKEYASLNLHRAAAYKKAHEALCAEVALYGYWLNGEVYTVDIHDAEGEFIQSFAGCIMPLHKLKNEVKTLLEQQ